jgi:hypothetical protein
MAFQKESFLTGQNDDMTTDALRCRESLSRAALTISRFGQHQHNQRPISARFEENYFPSFTSVSFIFPFLKSNNSGVALS